MKPVIPPAPLVVSKKPTVISQHTTKVHRKDISEMIPKSEHDTELL